PLELRADSQLGVPGLVGAVRAGTVVVANALGSGLLEARALLGFTPALARALLGEDLKIPNIATWWCGQDAERSVVEAGIRDMVLAPAFLAAQPGPLASGPRLGASLSPEELRFLPDLLSRRGPDYVGQEAVQLSTMPVSEDGRLVPRP